MNQQTTDRLVEDYLGAVSYACRDLPPDRRDDLLADLREHIEAARAVLHEPTEAAIRTILDRLGEPSVIAAEARLGEPLGQAGGGEPFGQAEARFGAALPPPRKRMSPAILGMVLGFVLLVIIIVLLSGFLTMESPAVPDLGR